MSELGRPPVLQVSKPVAVTVGGNHGLYVEVKIPYEVDAGTCIKNSVAFFTAPQCDLSCCRTTSTPSPRWPNPSRSFPTTKGHRRVRGAGSHY